MFNNLYIVHRTDNNNKNIYWTQTGNDSPYSEAKRKEYQRRYCGAEFDTILKITLKDGCEAKKLQLIVNEIFKQWTNVGNVNNMQISISLGPNKFIQAVRGIYDCMNDDVKLNAIQEHFADELRVKGSDLLLKLMTGSEVGIIYLIKCANGKLKIGKTSNLAARFERLKECEAVKAIEILDSFRTETMSRDEAKLHRLCSNYKRNSNGEIRELQDVGNSELFDNCKEVIDIWNEYKETKR